MKPFRNASRQKTPLLFFGVLLALTGCHHAAKEIKAGDDNAASRPRVLYAVTDPNQPLMRVRDTTDDKSAVDASPPITVPEAALWLESLNLSDPNFLSPVANGYGIVCCEPVIKTDDADLTAFGAGCGRWLQFTVGGQGELGKTPMWSSLSRAETELRRSDLRLTQGETEKLAFILGVTHAAAGELTGNAQKATLTYRLLELPGGKPMGDPITVSGTQAQIIAALPHLARQLALRLHVSHPFLPAAVGANTAEMRLLGSLPMEANASLSPAQSKSLRALSPRLPLAGMMRLHSGDWQDRADADAMVKSAVAQAPENTLLYGVIGWRIPACLHTVRPQFDRACRAFPNSYLLAHTQVWWNRVTGDTTAIGAAAKKAAQCAPQNPDAWLTLGMTISDMGDAVRNGRFIRDMTPEQSAFVNRIYPEWQAAVTQATQIDPLFWKPWLRVSQAAAFNGEGSTAREALRKALELDPANTETLAWAMQLYQKKWYNNPAELANVAKRAAEQDYATIGDTITVFSDLNECGHSEEAQAMLTRIAPAYQKAAESSPGDAQAQYNWAEILLRQPRIGLALKQIQKVVALRPNDAEAHFDLADMLDNRGRNEEAIREYRETLRRKPDHFFALYGLGFCLKRLGKFAEAEPVLRHALKLTPAHFGVNVVLGEVLNYQKKYKDAIPCFEMASNLEPYSRQAWMGLCLALAETGQSAQAVQAGRRAVEQEGEGDQTQADANFLLAYACAKNKQSDEALSLAEQAAEQAGDTAVAHADMGDVLNAMGRKGQARAEWQKALKEDPQGPSGKYAREMLAK